MPVNNLAMPSIHSDISPKLSCHNHCDLTSLMHGGQGEKEEKENCQCVHATEKENHDSVHATVHLLTRTEPTKLLK